jgi:hypothetical protein
MVWVASVSRSGFWADDFLNLTHFNHSLGDLGNDQINKGKYVINVFWALGTMAFGMGSVVPYLLLNTLVLVAGLVMWLRVGVGSRWSAVDAWWIAGLFLATSAWLATAMWSSNITHSAGLFALGAAMCAHARCLRASTRRDCWLWSLVGGLAWTLAQVSDLLYLGILVIAAYCTFHQVEKLRGLGVSRSVATALVGGWNLVVPIVYCATIGYPATVQNSVYGHSGYGYFRQDFDFYRQALAPTTLLTVIYILICVLAVGGAVAAARRRDWFPAAVLGAAVATVVPALVQAQQRDIHYVAIPLLLLFSAVACGIRRALKVASRRRGRLGATLLAGCAVAIILIFRQGEDVRSFFVNTPYGGRLATFRAQVAELTPEGGAICATLNMNAQQRALLIAEMSGEDGFLVPPISASQAFLLAPGQTCPASAAGGHIMVGLNARGDYAASQ